MSNRVFVIIVSLVFISLTISGCSSKKYDEFRNDFFESYFEVAESIDISNTEESLKNLQSDENVKDIEKLKHEIDNISNDVPSEMKDDYEMLNKWYDGIALLENSYKKWDDLSTDEKGYILAELRQVALRLEDKDKYK